MTNHTITPEKLEKYFSVTRKALEQAKQHQDSSRPAQAAQAADVLDMAQRYFDDAHYFLEKKGDAVLAFAALNYAHGWLDAGARIGLFTVKDNQLFTVD
jgi:hypothetical protein